MCHPERSEAESKDPVEITLKLAQRDPSQPSHKATARQATSLDMTKRKGEHAEALNGKRHFKDESV